MSVEDIRRRNFSMVGEKNPRWNGGTSEYPDHYLLKKNRILVLKKTAGKCEVCSEHARIVHHIDGSTDNHSQENLMPLCHHCHRALHAPDYGEIYRKSFITPHKSKTRTRLGMSIDEIATVLNIKPTKVRYHLAHANPLLPKRKSSLDILARISQVVKIPLEDLLR